MPSSRRSDAQGDSFQTPPTPNVGFHATAVDNDEDDANLLVEPRDSNKITHKKCIVIFAAAITATIPLIVFIVLLSFHKGPVLDPYCSAWSALNAELQRKCSQDGTNCGNRGNILVNRTDVIVSSLPAIVTLNLKFPDNFMPTLNGANKLAIVFARAINRPEPSSIDSHFQAAVISLSSLYEQLKSVEKPYGLIKEKFPLELFFSTYPVTVEFIIAFGGIKEWHGASIEGQTSSLIWAASARFVWTFQATSDLVPPFSVPLTRQTLEVLPLLKFVTQRAGWTKVLLTQEAHGSVSVVLNPYCNDNRYLGDCSRYCSGRNDQFGHYLCLMNGAKQCLNGFTNPQSSCRMPDSCRNKPCLNGGVCMDTGLGPKCSCKTGFQGRFCGDIVDFCGQNLLCTNGGTCVNIYGGFKCLCKPTFYGVHCEKPGNTCKTFNACKNGATCINSATDTLGYRCKCTSGFRGKDCDQDINECTDGPGPFCLNGGSCVNTYGSAFCMCLPYTSGPHCENNNPPPKNRVTCDSHPCFNGGTCETLAYDNFGCNCTAGFTGLLCQHSISGAPPALLLAKIPLVTLSLYYLWSNLDRLLE